VRPLKRKQKLPRIFTGTHGRDKEKRKKGKKADELAGILSGHLILGP